MSQKSRSGSPPWMLRGMGQSRGDWADWLPFLDSQGQCPTRLSLTPEQLTATTAAVPQADVIHTVHTNAYKYISTRTDTCKYLLIQTPSTSPG